MSSPDSTSCLLIRIAAEGMAPAIPGCSATLAAGSKHGKAGKNSEGTQLKGINYFGPRIVDRWLLDFGRIEQADQVSWLVELAKISPAESRREATNAVEELAPTASADDKALAIEYLSAIPLAVKRSLVPNRTTGKLTLYPVPAAEDDRSLLRLLPVDVPPFAIGTMLPGTSYELQELVGIGGFGAVYKARNRFEQNQPPRAIKFCLDSTMLATLYRERTMLDRMMAVGHKNWSNRIVWLYGYALEVQPPFLVYEFVPGGDLTSHLTATRQKTGRGFRPRMALELVRQVAEALAFAHEQGLVHRDLKPANILVSGTTIKLTDFGIGGVVASYAARVGSGGSITGASSAADQASIFRGSGTPLYMSAEQRRGENPDPRHDLYSLGVVWYQLLVGDVTRELHPGWPDELIEEFRVPREHIELIQRCVGYYKKRPVNAGELLSQLPSPPQPVVANPGMAASPNLQAPAASRPRAADSELERLKSLLSEQIDHDAWHQARATAASILKTKPNDKEAQEAQQFAESRLSALPKREKACFQEHTGWVRAVSMAPDGHHALSGGDDATLRYWDLAEQRQAYVLRGHSAAVMSIAIAPNGQRAVSGSWDGTIRLWDLKAGKEIRQFPGGGKPVKCVALTPDGRRVLSAGDDHLLHLWDLKNGAEAGTLPGHTDLVHSVAISKDGKLAVSGGDDKSVRIWDLATFRELKRFDSHADTVTSVAFAPDGRWVVSGSSDNTVRLWDIENEGELCRLVGHQNWINSIAVTADGHGLLTASGGEVKDGQFRDGHDTTVRLWDVESGRERARMDGHLASVTCLAVSADGSHAISGSLDRTVRWWDLR